MKLISTLAKASTFMDVVGGAVSGVIPNQHHPISWSFSGLGLEGVGRVTPQSKAAISAGLMRWELEDTAEPMDGRNCWPMTSGDVSVAMVPVAFLVDVLPFVSKDRTRESLCGAVVQDGRVFGTDGTKLVALPPIVEVLCKGSNRDGWCIPAPILKILKAAKIEGMARVEYDGTGSRLSVMVTTPEGDLYFTGTGHHPPGVRRLLYFKDSMETLCIPNHVLHKLVKKGEKYQWKLCISTDGFGVTTLQNFFGVTGPDLDSRGDFAKVSNPSCKAVRCVIIDWKRLGVIVAKLPKKGDCIVSVGPTPECKVGTLNAVHITSGTTHFVVMPLNISEEA
jgi:hypothetical protein